MARGLPNMKWSIKTNFCNEKEMPWTVDKQNDRLATILNIFAACFLAWIQYDEEQYFYLRAAKYTDNVPSLNKAVPNTRVEDIRIERRWKLAVRQDLILFWIIWHFPIGSKKISTIRLSLEKKKGASNDARRLVQGFWRWNSRCDVGE